MFGPVRLSLASRISAPSALVWGVVAVTALFAATPFLLSEVADKFGVSVGSAAMISVVQVGAFALANLALPRFAVDPAKILRPAAWTLLGANLVSAVVPTFELLLLARVFGGLGAGAVTWVAWVGAMRAPKTIGSVAAAGPVAALVAAPVTAYAATFGVAVAYVALASVVVPLLMLHAPQEAAPFEMAAKRSRSRSNRVLLAAMMLLTMSGAALFVFEATAAETLLGLSGVQASWGFSANAAGGILGAKLSGRHRRPGVWLLTAGPAAYLTIGAGNTLGFYVGMTWWGFAFWMGVPGVLKMLSERSLEPGERAGDAQGYMAVGRAVAPGIGGLFVNAGSFIGLATAAAFGLSLAGGTVMGVQEGRERLPATDSRTVV